MRAVQEHVLPVVVRLWRVIERDLRERHIHQVRHRQPRASKLPRR
jgi:hypothetical protein